ncbi:MAG: 2OG-Fe dioxygenase family protein [Deltaproteobacteria bacterium]|nr:2OG-Fe dioxygenase family protein [Deltaproteobacteria bacterium]
MTISVRQRALEQLQSTGFFSGSIYSLFDADADLAKDIELQQPRWRKLGLDKHMRDGGTYRYRRFSEMEFHAGDGKFSHVPHRAHYQPTEINKLNGGEARWFEPVEEDFFNSPIARAVIHSLGQALSGCEGNRSLRLNVHQVRIVSDGGREGKPVPEGIHRDGISFGILVLMKRSNIGSGGHTTIFSPDREPLFERTLLNPGDCILYNDRLFLHDTSPIRSANGDMASRDMFIVEYSRPEDETQVIDNPSAPSKSS